MKKDPLPSVLFNVSISDFQPIGSIDALRSTLSLAPGGDSRVQLLDLPGGLPRIRIQWPSMKARSPLTLCFELQSTDVAPYHFLGIALARADHRYPERLADYVPNFPRTSTELIPVARGNLADAYLSRLTVVDNGFFDRDQARTTYSFALFVQHLKSGMVGIIDPDLENDFDPASGH